MKTAILVTLLAAMSFNCFAVQRTMIKQKDEVEEGVRTCTYSGGGHTVVISVDSSEHCTYTETFEVD